MFCISRFVHGNFGLVVTKCVLITANIDTPKVLAISEIILRIATTYPQAIMYSYRLSKDNYCNSESISADKTKLLMEQLDKLLLNDPLVDKFLAGIQFS